MRDSRCPIAGGTMGQERESLPDMVEGRSHRLNDATGQKGSVATARFGQCGWPFRQGAPDCHVTIGACLGRRKGKPA